jgi:hypothetical protein
MGAARLLLKNRFDNKSKMSNYLFYWISPRSLSSMRVYLLLVRGSLFVNLILKGALQIKRYHYRHLIAPGETLIGIYMSFLNSALA